MPSYSYQEIREAYWAGKPSGFDTTNLNMAWAHLTEYKSCVLNNFDWYMLNGAINLVYDQFESYIENTAKIELNENDLP